jgi:hypothetical protein
MIVWFVLMVALEFFANSPTNILDRAFVCGPSFVLRPRRRIDCLDMLPALLAREVLDWEKRLSLGCLKQMKMRFF